MKTAKKLIALLLSVLLCVSMVPSAFAAAVSYTAEVSPAELTVSDEDQTVCNCYDQSRYNDRL